MHHRVHEGENVRPSKLHLTVPVGFLLTAGGRGTLCVVFLMPLLALMGASPLCAVQVQCRIKHPLWVLLAGEKDDGKYIHSAVSLVRCKVS